MTPGLMRARYWPNSAPRSIPTKRRTTEPTCRDGCRGSAGVVDELEECRQNQSQQEQGPRFKSPRLKKEQGPSTGPGPRQKSKTRSATLRPWPRAFSFLIGREGRFGSMSTEPLRFVGRSSDASATRHDPWMYRTTLVAAERVH